MSDSEPSTLDKNELPFKFLILLLEKIGDKSGDAKKEMLRKFIEEYRRAYGPEFYPLMRLLLPQADRERIYSLKEATLAKVYGDVMSLDNKSKAALANWKLPNPGVTERVGDFAIVAYEVIRPRAYVTESRNKSIMEVNEMLNLLCAGSKLEDQKKVFDVIIREFTAKEQKWLLRIILKDLKIGLSEKTAFEVFHPLANDFFNACSNLQRVCEELKDPDAKVSRLEITVFNPVRPMLAQRATLTDILSMVNGKKDFWIETKLDGERIQLHKQGEKYMYFSRNGIDYTHMYGGSSTEGSLTPYIHDCFVKGATSFILDGEMMSYNPLNQKYEKFGTLKTAGANHDNDGLQPWPCFVVYDLLMLRNMDTTVGKLSERYKTLEQIIRTPRKGRLLLMPHDIVRTEQELLHAIDKLLEEDTDEGLILKDPDMKYFLGVRDREIWVKIKPDYFDELGDSLDLLVIGGSMGSGKRSNLISTYVCALRDDSADSPTFVCFTRVGTGHTAEECQQMTNELRPHWTKYDAKHCPGWVKIGTEKPDGIVPFDKSFVIEVRAAETIEVNERTYPLGLTLRFPRFVRRRPDKDWETCMTVSEFKELCERPSKTLAEVTSLTTRQEKRKADGALTSAKTKRTRQMLDYEAQKDVLAHSRLLDNMIFYVVHNDKRDLQVLIKEHGGEYVQTGKIDKRMINILSDDANKGPVQPYVRRRTCDVLTAQWLYDSIDEGMIQALKPKYLLSMSRRTASALSERYDKYGDSYVDLVTPEEFHLLCERMTLSDELLTSDNIQEALEELNSLDVEVPHSIFTGCFIYVDMPGRPMSFASLAKEDIDVIGIRNWGKACVRYDHLEEIVFQLMSEGATITTNPNITGLTHIVLDPNDLSRLADLENACCSNGTSPLMVLTTWVEDSLQMNMLVPIEDKYSATVAFEQMTLWPDYED